MKFVNPNDGSEYSAEADENNADTNLQFGYTKMDGTASNGAKTHLLRLELYPLPGNGAMLDAMVQAMNTAAITTMEQYGVMLDIEGVFSDTPASVVVPNVDTLQ